MLKNLTTDIILNIQSFLLGEPDYLKLKYSNALKRLQRQCLKREIRCFHQSLFGEFPSLQWYIEPPRFTSFRRVFTHYFLNQVSQIKELMNNPDYYNDGGILLEVEYGDEVGYIPKHRIILSEDKIETVMTSMSDDYINERGSDLIRDDKRARPILRFQLHCSKQQIEARTGRRRRRRRRRNQ